MIIPHYEAGRVRRSVLELELGDEVPGPAELEMLGYAHLHEDEVTGAQVFERKAPPRIVVIAGDYCATAWGLVAAKPGAGLPRGPAGRVSVQFLNGGVTLGRGYL